MGLLSIPYTYINILEFDRQFQNSKIFFLQKFLFSSCDVNFREQAFKFGQFREFFYFAENIYLDTLLINERDPAFKFVCFRSFSGILTLYQKFPF